MHRITHLEPHDERGVVAVVVALLLTAMLGMGALVVDVGALYQEKRELQNGSDAGALAIAEDCAGGECGAFNDTATSLADPNAEDDATTVDDVTIDMAAQTVTVDTSTSDPGGGSVIAYKFAQVLGLTGDTVHASATAQWSHVISAPAVPLTISQCEWTANGGSDPSVKPVTPPSGTITLTFHSGNDTNTCNVGSGSSGSDLAGGFGWVDSTDDCVADYTVDDGGVWVSSKTGNTPTGTGCDPSHFALGSTILVPVFDGAPSGSGTKGGFHLIGYAALEISGVHLSNSKNWSYGEPCDLGEDDTGSDTQCLVAKFVKFFEANATTGGPNGPSFGVDTVALIK